MDGLAVWEYRQVGKVSEGVLPLLCPQESLSSPVGASPVLRVRDNSKAHNGATLA